MLSMSFIGCNGKYNKSSVQEKQNLGLDLEKCDSYCVHLNYKQLVEGYRVMVDFYPRASVTHGQCCTELYKGKAALHFSKDGSSFSIECEEFSDSNLICYALSDKEYVTMSEHSIDLCDIESGDTIMIDYIPPKAKEYLSWNSPFYFLDMDFDGKKDLVVNNMGCGYYGGNTYDVFSFENGKPRKLTSYPFEQDDIKLNSDCEYNPQTKTLSLKIKDGVKLITINPQMQFDGDPNVSGSTKHIGVIMKSIADGDAKTLASLAIYPIERRYPLRNIVSFSDMVKRFDQIFDQKFRNRMKSSKASDWHSYGWRGYSYGEDNALWVYDSLTIINYYSAQEKKLYDQLVKKEMASLHESLRGNGWYPFCCYRNKTDGSIIRIDIRARKVEKGENFHKDGVALLYPQLQAFKIRGDEEFRLSIYPKGYNLSEKPQVISIGYVDIGGSANMMNFIFKNGNTEIEFGDSYCEKGKELLLLKKDGDEFQYEIKECYWLDLIHSAQ